LVGSLHFAATYGKLDNVGYTPKWMFEISSVLIGGLPELLLSHQG